MSKRATNAIIAPFDHEREGGGGGIRGLKGAVSKDSKIYQHLRLLRLI